MIELILSSLAVLIATVSYSYTKKKKDPDRIKKIPFCDSLTNLNKER
ncbi:MAG: hypothetical protein WA945_06990 [Arcobacteraceae bacterium]